jgi:heat-inducible transcriptional repressor
MLTERRAEILRLIVADYIDTAMPVGSEQIVKRHHLGLSPATIRNEMAKLEEDGYISHPHTSAGRVPADLGYRYYVEMLMGEPNVTPDERLRILHQFHQATSELSEWLQLAASVLAQSLRNMAVVSGPRAPQSRLKHLEMVALHEQTALLVVVLQDVKVRQHVLALVEPAGQEDLSRISNKLNHLLGGMSAMDIDMAAQAADLSPLEAQVAAAVAEIVRAEDVDEFPDPHLDGIRNVLSQPEFAHSERLLQIMEALDERNIARVIPQADVGEGGVAVVIGTENRDDTLRDCSIVIGRYGASPDLGGTLAVVGPTRLPYGRAIATVRYVGSLMTEMVTRLHE